MMRRSACAALAAAGLIALSACGAGDSADEDAQAITVWTTDTLPDRVAATEAIFADFTDASGIDVELVGVPEDQFN